MSEPAAPRATFQISSRDWQTILAELRVLCDAAGVTRAEIAAALDMGVSTVSRRWAGRPGWYVDEADVIAQGLLGIELVEIFQDVLVARPLIERQRQLREIQRTAALQETDPHDDERGPRP